MLKLLACLLLAAPLAAQANPFKWTLPFDEQHSVTLRLFGSHRTRGELRTPAAYTADTGPVKAIHLRTRLGLDAGFPGNVNLLFELQDVRFWGDTPRAASNTAPGSGSTGLDVLQANLYTTNLLDLGVHAKLGRQRFTIGNQRLFSTLEWAPAPRAWDGLTLARNFIGDELQLFGMALLINNLNTVKDDEWIFGGALRWVPAVLPKSDLEALFFFNHRDHPDGTQDANVATASLRFNGHFVLSDALALIPTAEGIAQWGKADPAFWGAPGQDDSHVATFAAAVTLDLSMKLGEHELRLGAEYDYASGDSDPTDNQLQTFRAPFPFAHKYHGYADQVGWRNLHELAGRVAFTTPLGEWAETLRIEGAFHWFWRDNDDDAWYGVAGTALRPGDETQSLELGAEADLLVLIKVNRWFSVEAGWAHFFAGRFVRSRETAGGNRRKDMDFFYLQLHLQF